jgi:hypothetical protein
MKVVVGGCSVSNSWNEETSIDEVYGQILANQISADYIHHSVDGGSNYRIWRKITQMVMNNDITDKYNMPPPEEVITKDDIVIIQYTHSCREEYFSIKNQTNESIIKDESEECEVDDEGNIIRFKLNSQDAPNLNRNEKKFFGLKQTYFTSTNFDKERFEYHHYLFHNLMIRKNIKVIYLMSAKRPLSNYSFKDRNLFNKNGEVHCVLFEDNNEYLRHIDGFIDHYHFSKKGHEYVADELKKRLEQQGWL